MIPVTTSKDKRIALFGLGGSGMATALALVAGGADVVCCDDNPDKVEAARREGLETADLRNMDFGQFDELVLAPGVPLTHPHPHWSAAKADEAGIPIIGDIELFARERNARAPNAPFIAITGTNGKSTTTALISHLLGHAGFVVQMGGNIGTAILSLQPPTNNRVFVIECSSYQIDLAPGLNPSVGVMLNISPDHLDRHGTLEQYAAIKQKLVAQSDLAVVGVDDATSQIMANQLEQSGGSVERISSAQSTDKPLPYSLKGIGSLRGAHNAQNAAAAYAVCSSLGMSDRDFQSGLESFPGLVHRMEQVGHVGDVLFVNDTKATNAEAAAHALASYNRIYWIAGGLAKDGGIEELRPLFSHLEKAYFIGEAAGQFAATLGQQIPFEISETLDNAVRRSTEDAAETAIQSAEGESPVVLLSPACASFDQFPNFAQRGEEFKSLVSNLPGFLPIRAAGAESLVEPSGNPTGSIKGVNP